MRDKKLKEQRRKCQAYYSCVERILMYKTHCSMKRNDFPTYKPEAERRPREAQGQQKGEALIKKKGAVFFSHF